MVVTGLAHTSLSELSSGKHMQARKQMPNTFVPQRHFHAVPRSSIIQGLGRRKQPPTAPMPALLPQLVRMAPNIHSCPLDLILIWPAYGPRMARNASLEACACVPAPQALIPGPLPLL